MKKIVTLISFFALMPSVFSANIENVEPIDDKKLNLHVTQDKIFPSWEIDWDISIIKDIEVTYAQVDYENPNKVVANLSNDLKTGESYNFLWAYWADWDMDFTIWESLTWEIDNVYYDDFSKSIEKINILDPRTIEIYYNYEVSSQILEYKLLSELSSESYFWSWDNIIEVNLEDSLEKSTNYMVMISGLYDLDWNLVNFEDYLYEFSTGSNLITSEENNQEQTTEEDYLEEMENENTQEEEEKLSEFEDIALNAAETPDTWAATWFVMLLTFLTSTAYFMRNKFTKS